MSDATANTALGRVPRRARRLLNQMLQNKVVTPQGLNWLIAATDPFHDEPLHCEGYPDLTLSRSITQTLTFTTSVKTNQPSTDPWDCHVFFTPVTPSLSFVSPGGGISSVDPLLYRTGITILGQAVPNPATQLISGINILSGPNNADWITSGPGVFALNPACAIPTSFANGYFRVIAAAFEVVNTTAELYKGGSVTTYRSPAYTAPCIINSIGGYATSTYLSNLPPSSQTNAALFPDSRTWGATEGAYVVETLNSSEVPFVSTLPLTGAGLILGQDVSSLTTGAGTSLAWLPLSVNGGPTPRSASKNAPLPYDISGAIFAGLNPNSTLQVTTRYIIERIPAITDPNLLVLAREPCPFDPMILELYSRVMRELPVAVKVGENPLGEWFFDILQVLAGIAPAVGTALAPFTGPLGPMIGTTLGTVGTAALQARKAKQQKKKEKG